MPNPPFRHRGLDWRFAALAIGAGATIWLLGQRPGKTFTDMGIALTGGIDKIAHAAMYGFFALMLWRAQVPRSSLHDPMTRFPAAWVLLLTAALGAVDEFSQHLANRGRAAEVMDWVADVTGAVIVVFSAVLARRSARGGRLGG